MDIDKILPTNDVMFKIIFGDKRHSRILIHFLNAVIQPESPIVKVDIKPTEFTPDTVSQKGVRLDILAISDDGSQINVEIQKSASPHMTARALFYWSKVFAAQLVVGEKYENLHQTISINILDFKLFEKDERFWKKYGITDLETNEKLTDLFELHFIELSKIKEVRKDSPITFWIEFFKNPYSEQVKTLCDYVPEIKEAKEVFERAKIDPAAQELLRIREKALMDYASDIKTAEDRGEKRGHKKGKEEGREEERRKNALAMKTNVHTMKAKGFENKLIAECLAYCRMSRHY